MKADMTTLIAERDKWKRRAKRFQRAYRDADFERLALEIQNLDLRAHGADQVTARNNESLRKKLLEVCGERNALRMKLAKQIAKAMFKDSPYILGVGIGDHRLRVYVQDKDVVIPEAIGGVRTEKIVTGDIALLTGAGRGDIDDTKQVG